MSGLRRRAHLTIDSENGVRILALAGEVGADVIRRLDRALADAIHSKPKAVIVDLRQITFIDHTSLRVLVKAWRHATSRGVGFMLVRPGHGVWGLFVLTGLDVQLPSCFSLGDALVAFGAANPPTRRAGERAEQRGRTCETVIGRDPETVFGYVATLEHATEWRAEDFQEVVKESDGPIKLGSRYRYRTRRQLAHGEWIVDAILRPHWLRCTSPPTGVGRLGRVWGSEEYALIPHGDHTRLSVTLDVHFSGPIKLIEPLLAARMGRRLEGQLQRLKERVEA